LRREIERYYDNGLEDRIARAESELDELIGRVTRDVHSRHADEITSVRSDFEDIVGRFNSEMQSIRERRGVLSNQIAEELAAGCPDLSEYGWPEPAPGDEYCDPLFASTRDYVTQINRYKRHQGKLTDPVGRKARTLTCEVCGKPFEAKKKDAKYCSQACNSKTYRSRNAA
jgi:hypothetical protein